jgi:quercetin dioxygenase-like cupin family protein
VIIEHFFGPKNDVQGVAVGTYVKLTHFAPGEKVPMHEHVHGHLSILCSGWAKVSIDGAETEMRGPCVIGIDGGKHHEIRALSRISWACLHATDETDETRIDERLVG